MRKLDVGPTARYLSRVREQDRLSRLRAKRAKYSTVSKSEEHRRTLQRLSATAEKLPRLDVPAPSNFSLFDNTEEMLDFLDRIPLVIEDGFQPVLDLSDVESITPDAIAVLISTIDEVGTRYGVPMRGTEPRNQKMREVFRRSGFYQYAQPPRAIGPLAADRGLVDHHHRALFDDAITEKIVHFATERAWGSKDDHWPTYDALGEFMQNTLEHARKSGRQRWWVSVFYDEQRNSSHFTFLDTGLGILGSRKVKTLTRMRQVLGLGTDADILHDIFEGRLASRTEIDWRGWGLPRVRKWVRRGEIVDLKVLTNHIKGDVGRERFVMLRNAFRGTLYHWELRKK